MNNVLVRFVACSVLAVAWVMAWVMILYAGELPGEGFSASVLMLLVVVLQYVVLGYDQASRRLPPRWFFQAFVGGVAMLFALAAGPLFWGKALLTVFKVPLGPYTLSSTTLFDVALFLVVSGAMLAAFTHIQEPEA